ncbi:MAG: serine/threonine-protein kinase [Verrucomicrobiota bacterium]|nr:serine/threonine-protein kinase [Verrucomicrobiota bacterium]
MNLLKKITSVFKRDTDLEYKISSQLDLFEKGVFKCEKCSKIFRLEDYEPLEMFSCPNCSNLNFIPMRIGRFWLFQPLGGGGMGSVYKACHTKYKDDYYAVKILPREGKNNKLLVDALINEIKAANSFGIHPNITAVVSSGNKNGEYYYAMEFAVGERMDNLIDRKGKIPQRDITRYALQLLSAEQHMYDAGYLFRDLKPENIIITKEDNAILYDFGLCMHVEEARTIPEDMINGSPFYLPPERISGTGENMYSELYSLGQVMYHGLAGKTFFNAKEASALAKKHVAKLRLSLKGNMLKQIDPRLVDLLGRLMKKETEKRPQTFFEVEKELYQIYETL